MALLDGWEILSALDTTLKKSVKLALVYMHTRNRAFVQEALLITDDKQVYEVKPPKKKAKKVAFFNKKRIKTFAQSVNRILALSESGKLYMSMYGDGLKDLEFAPIKTLPLITELSCGHHHAIMLGEDRKLYSFQLTTPNKIEVVNVEIPQNWKSISCGWSFSAALTQDGEMYVWKESTSPISFIEYKTPTKVMDNVQKVVCGDDFILVLTNSGELFSFGENENGQLGLGDKEERGVPTHVEHVYERVKDISTTLRCGIATCITEENHVYLWGLNQKAVFTQPTLMTKLKSVHEPFYKFPYVLRVGEEESDFDPHNDTDYGSNNEEDKDEFDGGQSVVTNHEKASTHLEIDEREHSKEVATGPAVSNVVIDCQSFFNNKEDSNFLIQIEGKSIHVQKGFLMKRSKQFSKMLASDTRKYCTIKNYPYDVYYAFVYFLYTSKIEISTEQAVDLYNLAQNYDQTDLSEECLKFIKKNVFIDNVLTIYQNSIKHKFKEIKDICFPTIVENFKELLMADKLLDLGADEMNSLFKSIAERTTILDRTPELKSEETVPKTTFLDNPPELKDKETFQKVIILNKMPEPKTEETVKKVIILDNTSDLKREETVPKTTFLDKTPELKDKETVQKVIILNKMPEPINEETVQNIVLDKTSELKTVQDIIVLDNASELKSEETDLKTTLLNKAPEVENEEINKKSTIITDV